MTTATRGGAGTGLLTLLAFASLCSVLAPLNSTMIAVALPRIRDDFGVEPGLIGWLISGYLIAMAVAQPVAGRLGDQLGRARVVRTGLLAFIAASLATMLAPNFPVLVLLRVAQAIFGAGLIPNAMALLRERAPQGELGRLNGYNGIAIAAAAGVGPILGAAALAAGSWRFVFPASLPFAIGALALLPLLHLDDARSAGSARSVQRTDWPGTAQYAVLLAVVTFLLGHMRSVTVGESVGWALFLLALAVFIRGQRRAATPVAAWPLFRSRSFAAATADVLLVNLAMYTALLMIPFLVSDLLHVGAGTSGLLLGIMAGFMGLASPIGGHVSDRFGRRQAALLGGVLVLAAAALLSTALLAGVTVVELGLLLAMFGAGVGISTGAANTAAIESAPRALAGTAAGTSSMMRYVGSIVGTGILAAALGSSSTQSPSETFVLLGLVVTLTAAGAVAAAGFMHGQPPAENTIT